MCVAKNKAVKILSLCCILQKFIVDHSKTPTVPANADEDGRRSFIDIDVSSERVQEVPGRCQDSQMYVLREFWTTQLKEPGMTRL